MQKKILAIQGSSLKKVNIETDTTLFLALEAQKRGYQIYYYEPHNLSFIDGRVTIKCFQLTFFENIYFTESDKKGLDIGGFLKSYYTMLTMDIKYKSILKIHTKTNNKWFFALIYSLIGISINIIFNLTILYFYLKTPFDGAHALIALATSLSAWVQVLLMSYKLKSLGIIKENLFFNLSSLKIVLATLSMFLFLFFYGNILPFDYDTSMYERAGYLIVNIFVGSIIYFVSLMLLGVKTKSYKI